VLIFKQAIATGWDCPRAQILVMFREIGSVTFEIQTVGRILRMPELKHYEENSLNVAYVYTDLERANIGIHELAKNLIKDKFAKRRDNILKFNFRVSISGEQNTMILDTHFMEYLQILFFHSIDWSKVNILDSKSEETQRKMSQNWWCDDPK
jgi:type III restriction enzyme